MKARELFGVGVRLFGVWMICQGSSYVSSFFDMKLYPNSEQVRDSAPAHLIYATIDFAIAAFFLLWAPTIVTWSYGDQEATPGVGTVAKDPE